jgi:hypothetical protein
MDIVRNSKYEYSWKINTADNLFVAWKLATAADTDGFTVTS